MAYDQSLQFPEGHLGPQGPKVRKNEQYVGSGPSLVLVPCGKVSETPLLECMISFF